MDFIWRNLRISGFRFYGTSLFHPIFVCWVSNGVIKRYLSPFKLSCLSRQIHCIITQLGQRLLTSLVQSSCVFHSFKYDTSFCFAYAPTRRLLQLAPFWHIYRRPLERFLILSSCVDMHIFFAKIMTYSMRSCGITSAFLSGRTSRLS